MKSFLAFFRKELLEHLRSGRLVILGGIFLLFGVMNPAIAKLTPWLLEMMADSLSQSGMTITAAPVSALDSWLQFFKNIPMALIVFLIMESGIFTKEYRSGTLILAVTKGFRRYKILLSKALTLLLLWSVGYWFCFGITYGYTVYYWDNSVVRNLAFSVFCWYLAGLLAVALCTLFSSVAESGSAVLMGTGAAFLLSYLASLFPKLKPYSPALLMEANPLIFASASPADYTDAIRFTAALCVLSFAASFPLFRRKML